LSESVAELNAALKTVRLGTVHWYALAAIDSAEKIDAALKFCVWDGTRLFFNGELIFDEHSWHHDIVDRESIRLVGRPFVAGAGVHEHDAAGVGVDGYQRCPQCDPDQPKPLAERLVDRNEHSAGAVESPRIHWDGSGVQAEPPLAPDVAAVLGELGPVTVWDSRNLYFGGAHVAVRYPDGRVEAHGDSRRGGVARIVEVR
jgi:hypothetical protein